MADGSSSAAFERFCLLAKSQRGRAVVALIEQALSNKKVFVVGELLAMDNIQALRGTEFESHLRLLELFAYGTYSEYLAAKNQLPELNENMKEKLRTLSIVSLAHAKKKVTYTELQRELAVTNVRELEDLIIETIYAGLIEGKLDQANGVLNVRSAIARDVKPDEVEYMIQKLSQWGASIEQLIAALDKNMASVNQMRVEEKSLRKEIRGKVYEIADETLKKLEDKSLSDDADDEDDRETGSRRGIRTKRRIGQRFGMDF